MAFKYKFHQDRVLQPSVQEILQKVFTEVLGSTVAFSTVLDEALEIGNETPSPAEIQTNVETPPDAPEEKSPAENDVDAILKMFGGKVVS